MGHIFAFALGVIAIAVSIAVLVVMAFQLIGEFITWAVSL
jgi:hypothetical protein